MIDVKDIPRQWVDALATIQKTCPTAVLAGGCLRDLDNKREVKDLDIFIQARTMQHAEMEVLKLRAAGAVISFTPSDLTAYPEDQNLEVICLGELLGQPIETQLIFVNWDTSRIVERFDYGICRVSFDGTSITQCPSYEEDKEARVFRLRRDRPTAVSMRGSIHRYARLSAEKYSRWTWWPYETPGELIGSASS